VRTQHPQFPNAGLQRVRAFDVVDGAGQGDHLFDPVALIRSVEILIYPAPQVDCGADVEHLTPRTPKQVNPGPARQARGEHPFASLRLRHVG
jgi:hypothetical protein